MLRRCEFSYGIACLNPATEATFKAAHIGIIVSPKDAHGDGGTMTAATVDNDGCVRIFRPHIFLCDELFQWNVQPIFRFYDAVLRQFLAAANIDQNKIWILDQFDV